MPELHRYMSGQTWKRGILMGADGSVYHVTVNCPITNGHPPVLGPITVDEPCEMASLFGEIIRREDTPDNLQRHMHEQTSSYMIHAHCSVAHSGSCVAHIFLLTNDIKNGRHESVYHFLSFHRKAWQLFLFIRLYEKAGNTDLNQIRICNRCQPPFIREKGQKETWVAASGGMKLLHTVRKESANDFAHILTGLRVLHFRWIYARQCAAVQMKAPAHKVQQLSVCFIGNSALPPRISAELLR